MGVYDTYGNIQLKVGPCGLNEYRIGNKVPIDDGIYIAYGGAIVVKDGKLVAEFQKVYDKWGHPLDMSSVLDCNNAVVQALKGSCLDDI